MVSKNLGSRSLYVDNSHPILLAFDKLAKMNLNAGLVVPAGGPQDQSDTSSSISSWDDPTVTKYPPQSVFEDWQASIYADLWQASKNRTHSSLRLLLPAFVKIAEEPEFVRIAAEHQYVMRPRDVVLLALHENITGLPVSAAARCVEIVEKFGMKLLAILAMSSTFENGVETCDNETWTGICNWIESVAASLELCATKWKLNWLDRVLIKNNNCTDIISRMNLTILSRFKARIPDEPHPKFHYYITLLGAIDSANNLQENYKQQSIKDYRIDESQPDPTLRTPACNAFCHRCVNLTPCNCSLDGLFPDLGTELVQYPDKGIGMRALIAIPTDTIIDVYLGVVKTEERSFRGMGMYLTGFRHSGSNSSEFMIDAAMLGNETRYLNDSCRPNCVFRDLTVGARCYYAIQTTREIRPGEELCLDYGNDYWRNRLAPCTCDMTSARCLRMRGKIRGSQMTLSVRGARAIGWSQFGGKEKRPPGFC